MIKTPQVMTSANVFYATGLADKRIGEILARAELITEDGHKEQRLKAHERVTS